MTTPLSHSLKRQNHVWSQTWTTDWQTARQEGGQKSISVCQHPKLVPVVNKASLTPLSHIIPKFSQHFCGAYNGTGRLWQLLSPLRPNRSSTLVSRLISSYYLENNSLQKHQASLSGPPFAWQSAGLAAGWWKDRLGAGQGKVGMSGS